MPLEGPPPSDVTLMVAIARGARDALAEVYRRHGDQVYGLARRLCGHSRAEAVVQEVFLDLTRDPTRFVGDRTSLRTALLVQTYGRSVEYLAKVTEVETIDRDSALWRLHSLPEEERDAVVLALMEGHTYSDVARLLGEAEGTVKSRIRAGLTRLAV